LKQNVDVQVQLEIEDKQLEIEEVELEKVLHREMGSAVVEECEN